MTTNLRTMDVIPVIVNIVAGESAFDKSCEEEMSEMSSKEYPVRVKKKNIRERRVECNRHQRQKKKANAIS